MNSASVVESFQGMANMTLDARTIIKVGAANQDFNRKTYK